MRIAISGCGIAGPTLAFWLLRAGHDVVLIEASSHLRTGGYMIDFWGVGYTVAERMGILPQVREAGYAIEEVLYLDGRGRRAGVISVDTINRALADRFTSLPRGELASIIYGALHGRAETLFGTTITALEEHASGVRVALSEGSERDFDIVVGADGLHSNVRSLAFGPRTSFEQSLGYYVAAFDCVGYRPRDERQYVSCGVAGRQISRIALRDDLTTFLFVFDAALSPEGEPGDPDARKRTLLRVFDGMAWEWPQIARALEQAQDVYFDRVSQIVMSAWSRGRVALVGDAAACVSLVAGEGTGLGMTEAYVLAGEISNASDHRDAFVRYENRLRRFVEGKQKSARGFAKSFAPRTSLGVRLRNAAVRMMAIPGLPDLLMGNLLRDRLELPDYGL